LVLSRWEKKGRAKLIVSPAEDNRGEKRLKNFGGIDKGYGLANAEFWGREGGREGNS